jgi:hypothetical protein
MNGAGRETGTGLHPETENDLCVTAAFHAGHGKGKSAKRAITLFPTIGESGYPHEMSRRLVKRGKRYGGKPCEKCFKPALKARTVRNGSEGGS